MSASLELSCTFKLIFFCNEQNSLEFILKYTLGPTQRGGGEEITLNYSSRSCIQQEKSCRCLYVVYKMIVRFACSPTFCLLSLSHTWCGVCVWDFVSGTIWSSVGGCWPCRPTQHNSLSLTHTRTSIQNSSPSHFVTVIHLGLSSHKIHKPDSLKRVQRFESPSVTLRTQFKMSSMFFKLEKSKVCAFF